MIIDNINYHQNLFFQLNKFEELACPIFLKLDGLNFAGSIKLKPAFYIINELEEKGEIIPGVHTIIESSSGNLAVALAMVCHSKGYAFTAVVDPNTSADVIKLLKVYNVNVIVEEKHDHNGGYLGTRIDTIKRLIKTRKNYFWINQYANQSNTMSHYHSTAKEIFSVFNPAAQRPFPNYIFIGTSTTGTLNGVMKYFKEVSPDTKIVAVEPEGSVTFSDNLKTRYIPGIGASRAPELSKQTAHQDLHDIVWIQETDTIAMCNRLFSDYSLLLGGSTGSVVAAILSYKDKLKDTDTVIGISPDFGQKYLDTLYNQEWLQSKLLNELITDIDQ